MLFMWKEKKWKNYMNNYIKKICVKHWGQTVRPARA